LTQRDALESTQMGCVEVAGDRPQLESRAVVVIAAHEDTPGAEDFVGQQRGRGVQDDEIHAAAAGAFQIAGEPIELVGLGKTVEEDRDVDVARGSLPAPRR